MNFLTTDFSKLFLEKHKQDIFNKVCTIIEKERKQQCDNQYIELIFKIALFDFLGLSNDNIQKILCDLNFAQNIDILKILTYLWVKKIKTHQIHLIVTFVIDC